MGPIAPPKPRKKASSTQLAWYEERGDGYVIPHNFDNNAAIEYYEEYLTDLIENAGLANQACHMIARGVAALYDMKGGIEKDVKYYDRALDYLDIAQKSVLATMGPGGAYTPFYQDDENRKAKLQRKKERRLA